MEQTPRSARDTLLKISDMITLLYLSIVVPQRHDSTLTNMPKPEHIKQHYWNFRSGSARQEIRNFHIKPPVPDWLCSVSQFASAVSFGAGLRY
jgi:hypothetical protein